MNSSKNLFVNKKKSVVMELMTGGQLFEKIKDKSKNFSERGFFFFTLKFKTKPF
jgi:hypothetical protein